MFTNVAWAQNTESAEVHSCSPLLTVAQDLVYSGKQEGQVLYLPNRYFSKSKNKVDFGSIEPPFIIPKSYSMYNSAIINDKRREQ